MDNHLSRPGECRRYPNRTWIYLLRHPIPSVETQRRYPLVASSLSGQSPQVFCSKFLSLPLRVLHFLSLLGSSIDRLRTNTHVTSKRTDRTTHQCTEASLRIHRRQGSKNSLGKNLSYTTALRCHVWDSLRNPTSLPSCVRMNIRPNCFRAATMIYPSLARTWNSSVKQSQPDFPRSSWSPCPKCCIRIQKLISFCDGYLPTDSDNYAMIRIGVAG